jgi:hypothetical protein
MKLFNYQTNTMQALKDRIYGTDKPKAAWYYPTDEWITDPKEIERIIRENGMEL